MFNPWKKYILDQTRDILRKCINTHSASNVLNKKVNMDYLNEFHNQFVIVPVDKASKNIGIVCKLFYLQVLKEEIVSYGNFMHSDKTVKNIVEDYSSRIEEKYNNLSTHLSLPIVCWIPKFHKTLTEFRFITSGRHTVINTLSKKIAIGLQSMLKLEKTQCKFNHKFDGIKNYYIIDSNKEVIDFMIVSNLLNPGNKYIKTFDFKTLYTKIPHNKLKENLKIFI